MIRGKIPFSSLKDLERSLELYEAIGYTIIAVVKNKKYIIVERMD